MMPHVKTSIEGLLSKVSTRGLGTLVGRPGEGRLVKKELQEMMAKGRKYLASEGCHFWNEKTEKCECDQNRHLGNPETAELIRQWHCEDVPGISLEYYFETMNDTYYFIVGDKDILIDTGYHRGVMTEAIRLTAKDDERVLFMGREEFDNIRWMTPPTVTELHGKEVE